MTIFIQAASRHMRTSATHVLVFMISPEERKALPVQCVAYIGLSECEVRELANKVITEMIKRKMKQ